MRRSSNASKLAVLAGAFAARVSLKSLDRIAQYEVHCLDCTSGLFGEYHVEPRHLAGSIADDRRA